MSEYTSDSETLDTKCDRCGKILQLAEWPFCPHGFGSYNAQPNDIPGGLTLENLGHEKVTVYSRSELKRLCKERGVEPFIRHVPVPGTDRSPHTVAWTSVDLEAGKALAERQAHTRYVDSAPRPDPQIVAVIRDVIDELGSRN